MRILATGMSGLVGKSLLPALVSDGYSVARLKTGVAREANEIAWNPLLPVRAAAVSGFDAVIHLGGESIYGRWTTAKKRRIRDSRVVGTRNLCGALAQAEQRPRVLLSASAVGYYGANRPGWLTEQDGPGTDFLGEVAREWEAATEPAVKGGIRVVLLRLGVVLGRDGGALAKMLPIFRLGLGGRLSDGKVMFNWIAVDDVVGAILFLLKNETVRGPVNLVAPNPVSNAELTQALGGALHRPAVLPVPAFAVKLLFGSEMAEQTALASYQAKPEVLVKSGYEFKFPKIDEALGAMV